jgi:hypothetical protein
MPTQSSGRIFVLGRFCLLSWFAFYSSSYPFMGRTTRSGKDYKLTKEHILATSRGSRKRKEEEAGALTTRSHVAAAKKIKVPTTPPPTPPVDLTGRNGRRPTKSNPPSCLDFGTARRHLYPGAKFCSHCDWLQDQITAGQMGRVSRNSKVFACKAKQTNLVFPTLDERCLPVGTKTRATDPRYGEDDSSCHSSDLESLVPTDDDSDSDNDSSSPEKEEEARVGNINKIENIPRPSRLDNFFSPSVADRNTEGEERMSLSAASVVPPLPDSAVLVHQMPMVETIDENESDQDDDSFTNDSKPAAASYGPPTTSPPHDYSAANTPNDLARTREQVLEELLAGANARADEAETRAKQAEKRGEVTKKQLHRLRRATSVKGKRLTKKSSCRDTTKQLKAYLNHQSNRKNRKADKVMGAFLKELTKVDDEQMTPEAVDSLNKAIADHGRKHLRKNVYNAGNCVKKTDMTGAALNWQAFSVLREIETEGKRYSRKSVFPSAAELKRAQYICEKYGSTKMDMRRGICVGGGEFVEFQPDEILTIVVKAFGLEEVAKHRPIRINLSIDGAQISKRIVHVTMGFKIVDVAAKCPFSGRPLFMNNDDQIMQSRNLSIPVKMVMKKETKAVYDEFTQVFNKFLELSDSWDEEKSGPRPENKYTGTCGYKPLKLALNMDLSATWKLYGVGGAAKNMIEPCHCCALKSKKLVEPNAVQCNKWCALLHGDKDPSDWSCYHHEFLTDANLSAFSTEMEDLKVSLGDIVSIVPDEPNEKALINQKEDPRAPMGNSLKDIGSIHFDYAHPSVSEAERVEYSENIDEELEDRNLPDTGTLSDRQNRLKESLKMEYRYRQLKEGIARGEKMSNSACAFSILDAVPCVLHMENRVGLKMLTLLLSDGLSHAKSGQLYGAEFPNNGTERVAKFVEDIEVIINKYVLGEEENPAQWDCPLEGENLADKRIGKICLDNNRTRKVVENLSELIDLCIIEPEKVQLWKESITNNYVPAMRMLRRKADFSDEDIMVFQKLIDEFFQPWVKLHRIKGVTNYIHLLASGHISEYLRYWRSLYPHSQQGWESLNALIKQVYFRRSARGGANLGRGGKKSRILPVARWLLRRLMWATGVKYQDMQAVVKTMESDGDGAGANQVADEDNEDGEEGNDEDEFMDDMMGDDVLLGDDILG